MDKVEIAVQVLLKLIETDKAGFDAEGIAAYAWEITDAMQAEADGRVNKERPDVLREWQPDWSQAPDWANWWAIDLDMHTCYWYELKPSLQEKRWYFDYEKNKVEGDVLEAPSFNYQGNWQDSLRKRP